MRVVFFSFCSLVPCRFFSAYSILVLGARRGIVSEGWVRELLNTQLVGNRSPDEIYVGPVLVPALFCLYRMPSACDVRFQWCRLCSVARGCRLASSDPASRSPRRVKKRGWRLFNYI